MVADTRAEEPRNRDVAPEEAWLRHLWKRLDASRTFGLGAEMAFWLFLSLLPLLAVAGLLAAKVALGSRAVMEPLMGALPQATRELVSQEFGKMAAWNGGEVGLSAGLMFLWLASTGIHSIFDGIEIEGRSVPRAWWKKRALSLGAGVALSVGIAVFGLLGAGVGGVLGLLGASVSAKAVEFESTVLGQLLRIAVGAGLLFGIVSGLYWLALPKQGRRSMPVVPGALVAVGLQISLAVAYAFYIDNVGDGGAYQAGLATVGVTLMVLYLCCVALLVGVEVNQMVGERRPRPIAGSKVHKVRSISVTLRATTKRVRAASVGLARKSAPLGKSAAPR